MTEEQNKILDELVRLSEEIGEYDLPPFDIDEYNRTRDKIREEIKNDNTSNDTSHNDLS